MGESDPGTPPDAAAGQVGQISRFSATDSADGVRIYWRGDVATTPLGAPAIEGWTNQIIGGTRLPAKFVALRVPDGVDVAARVTNVASQSWYGQLTPTIERPPVLKGPDDAEDGIDQAPPPEPGPIVLPDAPIKIIRDSRMRGVRIVVARITPLFQKAGQPQSASVLEAVIPQARLLQAEDVRTDFRAMTTRDAATSAEQRVLAPGDIPAPPRNAAALTNSVRITVTTGGIQQITPAMLAGAGIATSTLDPAKAKVYYKGNEIPLDVTDAGTPGQLDNGDSLYFYALPPGDQLNKYEIYWLVFDTTAGARMATRDVSPAGATLRTSAFEEGQYYNPTNPNQYKSLYGWPDGAHWYSARFATGGVFGSSSTNITFSQRLPLLAGNVFVTATFRLGSAGTAFDYMLTSGASSQTSSVSGQVYMTVPFTVTQNNAVMQLTQLTTPNPAVYRESMLYRVYVRRPVSLNFTGSIGDEFTGAPGLWRYGVTNSASGRVLYDVTNPAAPQRLNVPAGTDFEFQDGSAGIYRRYLLTGTGSLFQPALAKHTPVDFATKWNARAVYIGPQIFAEEAAPLVNLRQSQGISARFFDAQAIYDAWSYGLVSPLALRDFLRYAVYYWDVPPVAATLLGDSTYDPLNYYYPYPNVLPAFMLPTEPTRVELFVGAAPCDTCIAQLDGPDPIISTSRGTDPAVLPDIWIGRIPARSESDLVGVVNKILGYETLGSDSVEWQKRVGYISDNTVCSTQFQSGCVPSSDYPGYLVDPAGNFYSETIKSAALQPTWATTSCTWYMPANGPATSDPCYERDKTVATNRTTAMYNDGASLMVYNGHGSHTVIAQTETPNDYMLTGPLASGLNNLLKLPVVIQMTCFTSQFTMINGSGRQNLDEALVLNPAGGAIATWGGTGQGVVSAHEYLQNGFLKSLWSSTSRPPLGQLTDDGLLEVFTAYGGEQDTLYTYLILGDPLTRMKLFGPKIYLPTTLRAASSGW